jgi:hypothetical protein
MTFDSTSPPSVAGHEVVFVGLDNEDDPHYGGIYLTNIKPNAELRPLAEIGKVLPGLAVPELTRIGEALSYDGRYLAFWGAWGTEMKTVRLYCPTDGNSDLIQYCNGIDPNSILDPDNGQWYQEKQVPKSQGIYVYDVTAGTTFLAADTVSNYNDFLFWVYSGKPPGTGTEETAEPPRWRGAAFVNVSNGITAFKARTGILNEKNVYVNPIDGLYLKNAPVNSIIQTVAETGMPGSLLDPSLQGSDMPITGLGIERDGFRGQFLAITATMGNEEESWGGIYLANVQLVKPNDPAVPKTKKGKLLTSEMK